MANSDCKNILNLIPLYIDNMLSEEENDIVGRHICSCENCKKEFEFMSSLLKNTKVLPEIQVPPEFHNKLMSQVRRKKTIRRILSKRAGAFVAAAAIIALSIVAISDFHISENSTNPDKYIAPNSNISDSPVSLNAPDKEDNTAPVTKNKVKTDLNKSPIESADVNVFGDKSGEAPYSEQESTKTAQFSVHDEDVFKTVTIVLTESTKDTVLEILADCEKDQIGYIVDDINYVTDKLSQLGIEVKIEEDNNSTKNYIVVK